MNVGFNLTIRGDLDKIKERFIREVKKKINQALKDSVNDIESKIHVLIRDAILRTPEVDSMINGRLKGELGLKDPSSYINEIIQTIQDHTVVQWSAFHGTSAKLTVKFLRNDHKDVLLLPIASYASTHGFDIEWLKWLLTRGDDIILQGYTVETHFTGNSRSGVAIMVKKDGGIFFIPSEFSGVLGNNFLTRSFLGSENTISKIIEDAVKARL